MELISVRNIVSLCLSCSLSCTHGWDWTFTSRRFLIYLDQIVWYNLPYGDFRLHGSPVYSVLQRFHRQVRLCRFLPSICSSGQFTALVAHCRSYKKPPRLLYHSQNWAAALSHYWSWLILGLKVWSWYGHLSILCWFMVMIPICSVIYSVYG